MGSRYFIIAFLPPLSFDSPPELSSHEVEFFLRLNLSRHEMKTVDQLHTLYDLENIRSLLMDLPLTATGNIPHDDLREMMENDECPLHGLETFFVLYPTLEKRKEHVHELIQFFFRASSSSPSRCVLQYFWIENVSRCLMAHLRATALGKTFDIDAEEIGFDPNDTKSWPELFAPLASLWATCHHSPLDLEEAFSRWKFNVIGTLCANSPPFSIDYVLTYLLQLRLVESRREIKNPAHQNILERIAKAVQ
jgi:hypothetical protein